MVNPNARIVPLPQVKTKIETPKIEEEKKEEAIVEIIEPITEVIQIEEVIEPIIEKIEVEEVVVPAPFKKPTKKSKKKST